MTFIRRVPVALVVLGLIGLPSAAVAAPLDGQGVGSKRLTIGIHAPFTGAAPLPSQSFQQGADLYFRWLEHKDIKINGRYVDVVIKNDNSNPSQAVAACKEMVKKDSAFLLVGIAGPESIHACGRYAASVGVPYISWAASTYGMKKLKRYFATSMPYEQQAGLIAKLLVARHDAKSQKNGIVWPNAPVYKKAKQRFVARMKKLGASVDYNRSVPVAAGSSEAQAIATEMQIAGVENVFYMGRTTFWINLQAAMENQGVDVQWAGMAPMLGTDDVVRIMCNQTSDELRADMLSYVPAFRDRKDFDANHDLAMLQLYGDTGDDTTWTGWAMGRNLAAMLKKAPRRLTHRTFVRKVTEATIRTGIGPALPYGRGGAFVARKTHLLRANCSGNRWVTEESFVSKF